MTHNLRLRWIGTLDRDYRLLRLARLIWDRGTVGDGLGYSAKVTVGLRPKLWQVNIGATGWIATIAGVRVHHERSYGGRYV